MVTAAHALQLHGPAALVRGYNHNNYNDDDDDDDDDNNNNNNSNNNNNNNNNNTNTNTNNNNNTNNTTTTTTTTNNNNNNGNNHDNNPLQETLPFNPPPRLPWLGPWPAVARKRLNSAPPAPHEWLALRASQSD